MCRKFRMRCRTCAHWCARVMLTANRYGVPQNLCFRCEAGGRFTPSTEREDTRASLILARVALLRRIDPTGPFQADLSVQLDRINAFLERMDETDDTTTRTQQCP